ncbi:hypothetical protein SLEP1_g52092 [Rubroshorea leprosula]|uniref:Uncharacterized protein n=1 Tax=Rubroshorea leprosula TaxID=152421 RepID=A0AAV5M5E0_9ROSI|nr:hypothetical protein SLEP1_g52092 [Rubroshorea leprosula]
MWPCEWVKVCPGKKMVRSKIQRDVEGSIRKCFFKENKRLGAFCIGLSPRAAGMPLDTKLEYCELNSDSDVFIKENPFMERREKKNQPKPSPSFSLYIFWVFCQCDFHFEEWWVLGYERWVVSARTSFQTCGHPPRVRLLHRNSRLPPSMALVLFSSHRLTFCVGSIKRVLDKWYSGDHSSADLDELLSDCITAFKHSVQHRNDIRFLKIWFVYVINSLLSYAA